MHPGPCASIEEVNAITPRTPINVELSLTEPCFSARSATRSTLHRPSPTRIHRRKPRARTPIATRISPELPAIRADPARRERPTAVVLAPAGIWLRGTVLWWQRGREGVGGSVCVAQGERKDDFLPMNDHRFHNSVSSKRKFLSCQQVPSFSVFSFFFFISRTTASNRDATWILC